MNKNFENQIAKSIGDDIIAFETKILGYLRKNMGNTDSEKFGNHLKYLHVDHQRGGLIKVTVKYEYTPQEIEFLEMIKGMPKQKLKVLEEYMEKLLNEK